MKIVISLIIFTIILFIYSSLVVAKRADNYKYHEEKKTKT